MLKRFCEGCDIEIETKQYYELGLATKENNENNENSSLQYSYGDYCLNCLKDGKATNDLIKEFK